MKDKDKTKEQSEAELKRLLDLIERAKQEWELVVDSLSQTICLLDNQGCILRANFAVEKWKLARVTDVKGLNLHELFHPGYTESKRPKMHELFHPVCTDPSCYMETFWSQAVKELTRNRPLKIEIEDSVLKRYLHIQILPRKVYEYHKRKTEAAFAVLIVDDITERKQAEEGLKNKMRELERFHKVVVGRELKMKELKERIKELEEQLKKK